MCSCRKLCLTNLVQKGHRFWVDMRSTKTRPPLLCKVAGQEIVQTGEEANVSKELFNLPFHHSVPVTAAAFLPARVCKQVFAITGGENWIWVFQRSNIYPQTSFLGRSGTRSFCLVFHGDQERPFPLCQSPREGHKKDALED